MPEQQPENVNQTPTPEEKKKPEVPLVPAEVKATAETVQVTSETKEEQMVTIPKKQYDELITANDSVFIGLMNVYDKFDDIMASIMNLNTVVFNKKRELRIIINELNKPQTDTN